MRKSSLFSHYLKGSTFLLLLSILVVGGVGYLFSEQTLFNTVQGGLEYHAEIRKERTLNQFKEQKQWLEGYSADPALIEFTKKLINTIETEGVDSSIFQQIEDQYRRHHKVMLKDRGVEDLFLFSPTGEIIFSLRPLDDEMGELMTSSGFYGETILSALLEDVIGTRRSSASKYGKIDQLGASTVLLGAPIYNPSGGDQDELVGVMVRPFSLVRLRQFLSSYAGLGDTGEVILAQRRGDTVDSGVNFINYFRNEGLRRPDEACINLRLGSPERFGIILALGHRSGSGWKLDNSCREVYSVWSWIPELRWAMVVKQDHDEIMAPIKTLQKNLVIAIIPLLLFLFWIVHRQSRTLSHPLERLISAVEEDSLDTHSQSQIDEVDQLQLVLQNAISGLQEAVSKADKANLAKDEFLASMSHELRTPLTSIIGNSEYLSEQGFQSELMKVVRDIETAGRSQLALVNDILDMSKIESGKFSIDEAPYDLTELLDEIECMLSQRARDSGLVLQVEQMNPENHQLVGDAQRIKQVLINLVGNAIKFTNAGSVSLVSRIDVNQLIFQVKDSGIGMPPEVLERLFQRFEQADGSISRRFGGSGLGLFISLNLAEMMGGTIEVSSQEGKGSTFELILPYRRSDLPVKRKKEIRGDDSALEEKMSGHVLIAEDTPELQLLERRILEGLGLIVTTANNGREAVDLAADHPFDLILMDMQMPEVDGIEATKILRSEGNRVPIVALTANVMQKHRELFDEAGCDGFLSKPINKQELMRMLKQHLNRA